MISCEFLRYKEKKKLRNLLYKILNMEFSVYCLTIIICIFQNKNPILDFNFTISLKTI